MISIVEALRLYTSKLQPLETEAVAVHQALHCVLANDVQSHADLPRFHQSAMDGYALLAGDTQSAPCSIPVSGTSAAGHWPEEALKHGTAWRIYTGAAIPRGADTVIPQEKVRIEGDMLHIQEPCPPGKNIRFRGEEIIRGATLAQKGQIITAGLIASFRSAGLESLEVFRQPRISLLVSGDEVKSPGNQLNEGDIPDSNGPYVQNWLLAHGYPAPEIIYVSDHSETVEECLRKAVENSDLIITTGGASVGDRDYIPETARKLGFVKVFWKVAQKPGKPLFFGIKDNQALLGLPGNPGAVVVGMEVHALTILNQLQGRTSPIPSWRVGKLSDGVDADERRDRLVRMVLTQDETGQCLLSPLGKQDSHMLSNLQHADVLVHLPSQKEPYRDGDSVRFIPLT